MDEKNNTINNNGNQDTMSYSFDFANQVDNTTPVQNGVQSAPVAETLNTGAMPTPAPVAETLNTGAMPTPASVAETLNTGAMPTPAPVAETLNTGAMPTPAPVAETLNTDAMPTPAPVAETLNASVTDGTAQNDSTQVASEVTNVVMPGVTPVVPVTPETVMAQNKEDENIELIKDKKATKNFLIVLFVLLIAFIIALPFIFQIMG